MCIYLLLYHIWLQYRSRKTESLHIWGIFCKLKWTFRHPFHQQSFWYDSLPAEKFLLKPYIPFKFKFCSQTRHVTSRTRIQTIGIFFGDKKYLKEILFQSLRIVINEEEETLPDLRTWTENVCPNKNRTENCN